MAFAQGEKMRNQKNNVEQASRLSVFNVEQASSLFKKHRQDACSTLIKTIVIFAIFAMCVSRSFAELAENIVQESGVSGGIIVHLNCGDGNETAKMRINERFIVQGLETTDEKVQQARKNIQSQEKYGDISVFQYDSKTLPYVSNLINLIVADGKVDVSDEEISRVLAPYGVAIIGDRKLIKPYPKDIDEWTHYLHDADNNAVANDLKVDVPRSVQWIAEPKWERSHEQLAGISACVSAQGRIFVITDEAPRWTVKFLQERRLVARDAFNGILLWKRDINTWTDHIRDFRSGPAHLPRRLIAIEDKVYVTLGLDQPVSQLDAKTGKTIQEYNETKFAEEILFDSGNLYLAVGSSEYDRAGAGLFERDEPKPTDFRYIIAINAETGKKLWRKDFDNQKESLIPTTLAVKGNNCTFQTALGVVCLNSQTGEEIWNTPRMTAKNRFGFSAPTLIITDSVVLCADSIAKEKKKSTGTFKWWVSRSTMAKNEKTGEKVKHNNRSTLIAYDIKTGKELWQTPSIDQYNSSSDIFVINNIVYVGQGVAGYSKIGKEAYKYFDLMTGEKKGVMLTDYDNSVVGMGHHRCHRNKATIKMIITGRSGIETLDLKTNKWSSTNSWIRGTCQYGLMPANGFIYAPPETCGCFNKVRLRGFVASAPNRYKTHGIPWTDKPALSKGKAYKKININQDNDNQAWNIHRGNTVRGSATFANISNDIKKKWSVNIKGELTQPIVVKDKVFVASTNLHTVFALNINNGEKLWNYTVGGRIDSSPTIYKGMVFFGSVDGYVYCLNTENGELVWKFRAAPQDIFIGYFNQLESSWPVHGTVLIQNDTLYFSAGRNTYLDGGIILYALNPVTGVVKHKKVLSCIDDKTGSQTGKEVRVTVEMEGTNSEILTGDGENIFLKHYRFDKDWNEIKEYKDHLFTVNGFLGEEWYIRGYWTYGFDSWSGWPRWMVQPCIAGRLICVDNEGFVVYGRKNRGNAADEYMLTGANKKEKDIQVKDSLKLPRKGHVFYTKNIKKIESKQVGNYKTNWNSSTPIFVRAMVMNKEKFVIAGSPDLRKLNTKIKYSLAFTNNDEALAAFKGKKGGKLAIHDRNTGKKISEVSISAVPYFDGMSVAYDKIFLSLKDGTVQCWE